MVDQPDRHRPGPLAANPVSALVGQLIHPAHCRSFEEDARHYGPLNRRPLGLRSVPLDRIVGSVGRARELAPNFQPLGSLLRPRRTERYQRIEELIRAGTILPPVEIYKLGYHYYVLDGNHRVAALKALTGNDGEIDADVTQFWPVGDTEAARVFLERRAFEQATGLTSIGAVERDHFPLLQAEIVTHQQALSTARGRPLPLKEAASDWLAAVWHPRAEAIRRSGLRRRWPDKRTADIYCYIRAYQLDQAKLGRTLEWSAALARFQQHGGDRRGRLTLLSRLLRLARPWPSTREHQRAIALLEPVPDLEAQVDEIHWPTPPLPE